MIQKSYKNNKATLYLIPTPIIFIILGRIQCYRVPIKSTGTSRLQEPSSPTQIISLMLFASSDLYGLTSCFRVLSLSQYTRKCKK